MLSKISNILRILGNICVILTVLICLVFSVFTIPRFFGITPFVVQSSSMEPEITTGSVVFTNTKDTDVEVGDVITYSLSTGEKTGVFVTHRVNDIDEERGLIQTKGDNNDNPDGWLEKSAITGTVLFHVPKVGFILDHLQEKGFVILAIWVFVINVLLMMLPYVLDMMSGEETPKEKKFKIRVTSRNKQCGCELDYAMHNAGTNKKGKGER